MRNRANILIYGQTHAKKLSKRLINGHQLHLMLQKRSKNVDPTQQWYSDLLQDRLGKGARRPYLHAGGTQHTPPVPIQAEHKGVGQAVQWRRQDVQQGEGEGGILRVEGIMEPVGRKRWGGDTETSSSFI